jgi:hypothetical protein
MEHVPLIFVSEWCEFRSTPYLAGKELDDSSHLDDVENFHIT